MVTLYMDDLTFTHSLTSSLAGAVELLLCGVPVPFGQLDRAVHQVPDGAGAAQGLPRDEALPRDPLPRAEGEQAPGAAPPLR